MEGLADCIVAVVFDGEADFGGWDAMLREQVDDEALSNKKLPPLFTLLGNLDDEAGAVLEGQAEDRRDTAILDQLDLRYIAEEGVGQLRDAVTVYLRRFWKYIETMSNRFSMPSNELPVCKPGAKRRVGPSPKRRISRCANRDV